MTLAETGRMGFTVFSSTSRSAALTPACIRQMSRAIAAAKFMKGCLRRLGRVGLSALAFAERGNSSDLFPTAAGVESRSGVFQRALLNAPTSLLLFKAAH